MARPAVGARATRTPTLTPELVAMDMPGPGVTRVADDGDDVVLDGEAWCYTFSPEPGS